MADYEMRTMRRDELDVAVDWAADEGWNPGLHDADAFYAADPSGFYVGVLDGTPVASLSVVRYSPAFAFVGFYLVRPDLRGNGYGLRVWHRALGAIEAANMGLDGVLEQVPNYERSGFTFAYHNIRFVAPATTRGALDSRLVPLPEVPFATLLTYDAAHFPASRPAFLRAWTQMPSAVGLAAVEDSEVRGYGLIRTCRSGYKVGPLFANDEGTAEALYDALAGSVEAGREVFLDVPGVNEAALRLVESRGMTRTFATARMYTNGQPDIEVGHVYGVTTLELG